MNFVILFTVMAVLGAAFAQPSSAATGSSSSTGGSSAVVDLEHGAIVDIKTNGTETPMTMSEVQKAKDAEDAKRMPKVVPALLHSDGDPCNELQSCMDCTKQPQCGWCAANE